MTIRDDDEVRPYASPVCYAHEFETNPLPTADVIAFLNTLLEGERAGAQGLVDMAKTTRDANLEQLLLDVARDEGRYCVMLRSHVHRLGGTATNATGVFYEKLMAREGLAAQLKLLDRGQSAVVKMIDEALPRIDDAALREDLIEMREVHVRNIARCAAVSVAESVD
jgi:nitronate monooxygenase